MRGVSLINFFGYNFTFQQLFVDVVGSRIRLVAALESIGWFTHSFGSCAGKY